MYLPSCVNSMFGSPGDGPGVQGAFEQLCERAFAAGASRAADVQDDGPMHGWSFRDPDGHIWEVLWMDAS